MGARWSLELAWPAAGACALYDLAIPLQPGLPTMPGLPAFGFSLVKLHGDVMLGGGVSTAAERMVMGGHSGTHLDGWAHVSRNGEIFGGAQVKDLQSAAAGVEPGSVAEMPPILAHGHLLDLPALLRREVEPGDAVGEAEFESWFADRRRPRPGSAVLLRTGWRRHLQDSRRYLGLDAGLPGVVLDGARWLAEHGVSAVGADTPAWEKLPSPGLPAHVHLLVERGVPILEMLDLEGLAGDAVYEFFLVALPLAIRGGTGSPIRPIAIVETATGGRA